MVTASGVEIVSGEVAGPVRRRVRYPGGGHPIVPSVMHPSVGVRRGAKGGLVDESDLGSGVADSLPGH